MSSYYPSFNYLGINSREKNLVVSHFSSGTDNGEVETFQSVESIYTEKTDGTRLAIYSKSLLFTLDSPITIILELL